MAYGSTHPTQVHHSDTVVHAVAWTMNALGVLAAMVGAWILLAPDDGTISFFGRTWAASDLTTTWGPWLLIVGGGVTAVGMGVSAVRSRPYKASAWLTAAEALLAIAGVAAVIAGVVILL